ncbi:hypothetical protein G7Y89_g9869 [Cudoniella acicularis]|uniref:Uncharacterized protein n=1 Tax=Cudoniella acicularis TaxID=354080 RepID=A0A8H4RG49_9HELO|nr:hypothetical protein G7Y89_g9869 [Cudoniella acicularis]
MKLHRLGVDNSELLKLLLKNTTPRPRDGYIEQYLSSALVTEESFLFQARRIFLYFPKELPQKLTLTISCSYWALQALRFRVKIQYTPFVKEQSEDESEMLSLKAEFARYAVLKSRDLTRNKTMGGLMEELSRKFTLSLFSNSRTWSNITHNATARTRTQINIYAYNAQNLLIAYGIAFLACTGSVLVGLRAFHTNSISHSHCFSGILSTARNSTLDVLTMGQSLGAQPLNKELANIELMFGVVDGKGEDGFSRLGFGVEGQERSLKKGDFYC